MLFQQQQHPEQLVEGLQQLAVGNQVIPRKVGLHPFDPSYLRNLELLLDFDSADLQLQVAFEP